MTTLKNPLHDSNNGLDYTLVNDYYLPNLTAAAPAEQHPTGRWGRLHKTYLKDYHVGEGVIIKRDTADAIDSCQHADRQKNNQNRNAKTGRK